MWGGGVAAIDETTLEGAALEGAAALEGGAALEGAAGSFLEEGDQY